jgi:hypothetical protein
MAAGLRADSADRTVLRPYERLVPLLYDRVEEFISVIVCDISKILCVLMVAILGIVLRRLGAIVFHRFKKEVPATYVRHCDGGCLNYRDAQIVIKPFNYHAEVDFRSPVTPPLCEQASFFLAMIILRTQEISALHHSSRNIKT